MINVNEQNVFNALVSEYLAEIYQLRPGLAAYVGVHDFDQELEDLSADALGNEAITLKNYQTRLQQLDKSSLSLSDRIDYRIFENNISARLLELTELRPYHTNPYSYCEGISQALLRMALFDYAPPATRIADATAKIGKLPQLLENAKANLENPAPILIDVGLLGINGVISLIERDLPAVFADAGDEHARAQFQVSADNALDALRSFRAYLDTDLRARANGDYALGVEKYQKRLLYEEGISTPLAELLKLAEAELARTKSEFIETAREVDNHAAPLDTWRMIQRQHPPAGELVSAAQGQLDEILQFINEREIVSWPSSEPARVAPTPEFMRWSFASMVSPGPFERVPLPSRYFITDVDSSWPAAQQASHLTYFSIPILWAISIHEVYPGHFVQFSHLKEVVSQVRRNPIFMPITYVEGWAHYTEQMMFEEGFLAGRADMRLGQLWEALLRLCRFIVAIKLHTREMTIDEATEFFIENSYADRAPARSEAERGSFDPKYLSYSLGKLQILQLRDEYKRLRGADFSLADFHQRLLAEGMAPIDYHRELMLAN